MTLRSFGTARRFQVFGVALMLGALLVWMFPRAASAAVTASANPNSGLGTTGTLAVSAGGFATDGTLHVVYVLECEHGATDSSQCDANTEDSTKKSNTAGNYTNNAYTYYQLPSPVFGVSNLICDATHLCDLLVIQDDYNNFSNPHVLVPITFAGGGDTTTTATTTTTASTTTTAATTTSTSTSTTTTQPVTTTTTGSTTTTSTTQPTTTTTGSTTTTSTAPTTTTTSTTEPTTTTSSTTTTTAPVMTSTTVQGTTTTTSTQPATTTTMEGETTTTASSTTVPGATTTTTTPNVYCVPWHHGRSQACFCIPPRRPHRGFWWKDGCEPRDGRGHHDDDGCSCDPQRGDFGGQGQPGSPGYNAMNASYVGQKLPEQGVPPAVPLMAICGFVILVAGTVLRRVVLRAPAA